MLRSHRIPCSRVPAPLFVSLRRATPSHFHLHERPSHGYSISAARSPFPARPLAVFRTPTPARRFSHARSLFSARPCPLAVSRAPACCLELPPPPRASSSASRFLLRLALPLRLASPPLRLARLRLAGEAEPGAKRDINWL
ncbi:hypothetical protein B0H13DRAFT_2357924 [Mycena leptocephala]|nr:hypothetical protein B0H13DRAFT_2357924 [Mycena leptocephala]